MADEPPSEVALTDEVRAALRELVDELGAVSARIVEHDDAPTGVPARTVPLGGGEYLRVELASRQGGEVDPTAPPFGGAAGRAPASPGDVEAAFDRITRQLRAIRRRWEAARLPEVHVVAGAPHPTQDRISARIESYLRALATIDRATNAFVTRGPQLIAVGRAPDELESSRWPFLARRVLATHAPHSSHGEIVDPDAYAMSFWYDASLIVLLTEPYAIDFVRHRCRHVARELSNLLPLLDPDPDGPAAIQPPP